MRRQLPALSPGKQFDEVLGLIEAAKRRAYQAVNAELVGLYWQVGEHLSKELASAEWADGVVFYENSVSPPVTQFGSTAELGVPRL